DRLMVCAGGLKLKLDADIYGSVRSIYEGDKTQGKAEVQSEAAFLSRIPEKDRLAALDLYHKCVRDIISGTALITQETLSFRFFLRPPFDLLYDANRTTPDYNRFLQTGNYFPSLLSDIGIDYNLMLDKCDWKGIGNFNSSDRYYHRRGHYGHMFP